MADNYFFIDGSALSAQIRQLRREDASLIERKLCPIRFVHYFMESLTELHEGSYKRATYYFPVGDEAAVDDHLAMPDRKLPGHVRDINFKFCGQKLKKSLEFTKFVEETVPAKFHSRFSKSEKGIDIEICCDAFKLASFSRLDRLFLMTNDDDFIPFCRVIKEFGANVSIIHLSPTIIPNVSLLKEADSYDVVPINKLHGLFLPMPAAGEAKELPLASAAVSSLKPEASPSDLVVDDAAKDVPAARETGDDDI
jgi:uncharacterized LabA/DUF88 family protein